MLIIKTPVDVVHPSGRIETVVLDELNYVSVVELIWNPKHVKLSDTKNDDLYLLYDNCNGINV